MSYLEPCTQDGRFWPLEEPSTPCIICPIWPRAHVLMTPAVLPQPERKLQRS